MRYINVEKLKHEIERLKLLNSLDKDKEYAQFEFDVAAGYDMALNDVISFLSTLEESKKPIISNDLDKAAKEYAKTTFKKPHSENPDKEVMIIEPDKYAGFIAGAKYEDEQLSEKVAAAYQLGLADKEKQMMSEAVESEVTETCGISSVWIKTKQFKPGQKVRIIIVKED